MERRIFGNNIEFGADADEITFAKKTEGLPVVAADPYLNSVLVKYCEEALAERPDSRGPFRSTVENAIVSLLPHGKTQAREIARGPGMSQTTFARRLAVEGLTFTSVVESPAFALANRYLADEGFVDFGNRVAARVSGNQRLSQAFKRWTGKTRSRYRPAPARDPVQGSTRTLLRNGARGKPHL